MVKNKVIKVFFCIKILLGDSMQIEHKQIVENGNPVIYINIYTEDNYEFSKENFNEKSVTKNLKNKIIQYIKNNVKLIQGAIIVIAINGVLIGALSLDKAGITSTGETGNEIVKELVSEPSNSENKDNNSQDIENNQTIKEDTVKIENKNNSNNNGNAVASSNNVTNNKSNSSTNKAESNVKQEVTNPAKQEETKTNPNTNNTTATESKKDETVNKTDSQEKYYIKLNSGGSIQNIELEEYVVGVVAAEMPASFNAEALKAQAIAARTYAVKKTSQGKTLVNSTSDQVYKTTSQMKSTWGSDYNYYYNKIRNAVNATKGLVLKYNGEYIDAQYSAMTNGKTELPEYVWSFSRPYLQCVSSNWDEKVKNFQVTKTFSYDEVSKKLGQTITKDTDIEVLSRTVSGRVEKIKIGDSTYNGTTLRSRLGLRSTDFTIELADQIKITTKGYGHGVGMSQYGANVAANEGYSYSDILTHYYVGVNITKI